MPHFTVVVEQKAKCNYCWRKCWTRWKAHHLQVQVAGKADRGFSFLCVCVFFCNEWQSFWNGTFASTYQRLTISDN